MKRDWNLIRAILLELQSRQTRLQTHSLVFDGFSNLEIAEHILLMHEGNLIESGRVGPHSDEYFIDGITSEGQRILKLIGDDHRWASIKTIAKRFDVGLTGDTIILISFYLDSQPCTA